MAPVPPPPLQHTGGPPPPLQTGHGPAISSTNTLAIDGSSQVQAPTSVQNYRRVDLSTWKQGELLGRGASGEVYRALCAGHFFAVKKIPIFEKDTAEVDALRKEIELLKRLDHPRVVRYVGSLLGAAAGGGATGSGGSGSAGGGGSGAGAGDGPTAKGEETGAAGRGGPPPPETTASTQQMLLIFLEYMPSGSMSSVLKKFGGYSLFLAKKYTRQMLEGLAFLHSRGIVHRDLKAANILVDQSGDIKLADLGACRQLASLHATMSGEMKSIKGSVYWMAPETMAGIIGRRCDIWSVGCTTIEMLIAAHPWSLHPHAASWSIAEALQFILGSDEVPPFPPEVDPETREEAILLNLAGGGGGAAAINSCTSGGAGGDPAVEDMHRQQLMRASVECEEFLRLCLSREHKERPYADQLLQTSAFLRSSIGGL